MVPGKAAEPWTLQGHRAELHEHWLSWAGGGHWQKVRGEVTSLLTQPKGGREGAAEAPPACPVPPWPRLTMSLDLGDGVSPNSNPHP